MLLITFKELIKVCTNLFFQDKHKGIEHLIEVENPNRMKGRAIKKVTELEGGKTELTRRERYVFIEDWILKRNVHCNMTSTFNRSLNQHSKRRGKLINLSKTHFCHIFHREVKKNQSKNWF